MSKSIAIVYFSGTGHTHLMAEKVAEGARSVEGVEVSLLRIDGKDIVEGRYKNEALVNSLTKADAIVFGSPTYMGNVAAQFKAFVDALGGLWYTQALKGKVAGAFTVSGSPSGDKSSTIAYLHVLADQLGMLWVGNGELPCYMTGAKEEINRFSFSGAAVGQSPMTNDGSPATIHPGDAATGVKYGERVASVLKRLG
ncbi:MAG TPA: NAD(P)H-dependent oxidoreductase [Opitutales bacterium]|nr:NAD(P)H-dependent oxidoreductase [Opitutales bacterium]